jgi:hypothetical protein
VTHKKGKLTILIVWVISISLGSVQLFVARVQPLNKFLPNSTNTTLNENLVICNEQWDEIYIHSIALRKAYTVFNFFAVYLIPVFILGLLILLLFLFLIILI